jgi:hypothetical protein
MKTPSTRLQMPDPRAPFIGLGMIVLGGIMVGTQLSQWRDLGWALIVIGAAAALWWVNETRRVAQFRRAMEQAAEKKAVLQANRKKKDLEERSRRDLDKKARDEQSTRLQEQRVEEGRRRREAEEAAAKENVARAARLEQEATRLRALELDALCRETAERLESRGYDVHPADGDPYRVLLLREDSLEAVCRIIAEHSARAADVRDLEAWRRDTGAKEAYLIAVAGFAPDAVRAAKDRPIILVEAHLLAAWDSTEAETSPSP